MGAKQYAAAILIVWLALPGCAGLKRLAPPGVIKYEELAGDQPPSPVIKERIAARQAEVGTGGYPNLSATPSEKPAGIPKAQREAAAAEIRAVGAALDDAVAEDRAAAVTERERGVLFPGDEKSGERDLTAAQEALADAIARDEERARRERGLPPRRPADDIQ
jgi:hypothetical protein